jgi:flagellar motor switch/type III secretory pathway protein FliN
METRSDAADTALAEPLAETIPPERLERILSLELPVIVVLAEKEMTLEQILALDKDAMISFDRRDDAPLDFWVNDQRVGSGKAIQVAGRLAIHVRQVDSPGEALRKFSGER